MGENIITITIITFNYKGMRYLACCSFIEKTTVVEDEKHKHKPNLPVYQIQWQPWQEIEIGLQYNHYIPHSSSWDTSPGNRQERGYTKHTSHFLLSANTGCKNSTSTSPTTLSFSGYKKPSPWGVGDGMLVLVGGEKLKWSKELANRLRLQVGENHRPFSLIYHPTACDPPQGQFPWSVPTWACSVGSGAETS